MKSCFFIGHREANEELSQKLEETVCRLITKENVDLFYVGGYGGFDRVAAGAVKKVKKEFPDIALFLVIPYHPAERPVEIPYGFDGTYYPEGLEGTPRRYAISRANRLLLDSSDWFVCYVKHGASNAQKLYEYAKRREKKGLIQIENLAD